MIYSPRILLAVALSLLPTMSLGQSAHLVAAGTGWYRANGKLFWTSDGGKDWKNITPHAPKHKLESVHFRSPTEGAALLVDDGGPGADFEVALTTDAGATWATSTVTIDEQDATTDWTGGGDVFFLDAMNGYVNLRWGHTHGAALFRTQNGGQTWEHLSNGPGVAGPMLFTDASNGWVASLDDGGWLSDGLFATHDAANSWNKVDLPLPPAPEGASTEAQLPTFTSKLHGFASVAVETSDPDHASLWTLYVVTTDDGGKSWKLESSLTRTIAGNASAFFVGGSTPMVAQVVAGKLTLAALPSTTPAASDTVAVGAVEGSFRDASHGWLVMQGAHCQDSNSECTLLLHTGDAGVTWANITPPTDAAQNPLTPPPTGPLLPGRRAHQWSRVPHLRDRFIVAKVGHSRECANRSSPLYLLH